jgi:predicted outer membrane repeat protein
MQPFNAMQFVSDDGTFPPMVIQNTSFQNNFVNGLGGALYSQIGVGALQVLNCSFVSNTAFGLGTATTGLGGAVAVAVGASQPAAFRGVVLENTFTSIPAMAGALMPWLAHVVGPGKPLTFLVKDTWPSETRIGKVLAPVLFISSGLDEMVPQAHMRALWAARAPNPRSVWLELPEAHHMDAWATGGETYWNAFRGFLQSLGCYDDDGQVKTHGAQHQQQEQPASGDTAPGPRATPAGEDGVAVQEAQCSPGDGNGTTALAG